MLSSGNGRHRRPRPTPAAVVTVATAAATGAGIALPLLGAGAAQAADAGTWDKVAVCETGGNWTAHTGNGFYGGLAITKDTWDQYGGDTYAKRPDLATRAQQIVVAEQVLTALGPNAWPGCETGTGLLTDSAPPDVNPTSTPVPDPSGPTGIQPSPTAPATDPTTDPTTDPATPTTPSTPTTPVTGTPADPGTPTGTPTTTAPPTTPVKPGTPVAGTPAAPGTTDPTDGSGRHARPYSPTDEQLAAADQATRTEVYSTTGGPKGAGSQGSQTATDGRHAYKVGLGDSLSSIATAHHVDGGWRGLYATNHKLIGDDPNLIKPGQTINLG
jgi:resuscitation-promoting factor RpfA